MSLVNMWLGAIVLIGSIVGGLLYIAGKQKKGLHDKARAKGIYIIQSHRSLWAQKTALTCLMPVLTKIRLITCWWVRAANARLLLKITNPVIRYSAAASAYEEFHGLMTNIVKILGDGYLLQKQDVISKSKYPLKPAGEYLQGKYNAHFAGRDFIKVDTYLTITLQVKKGAFYVYDPKALKDFLQAVR
jgi:hypothetical protein